MGIGEREYFVEINLRRSSLNHAITRLMVSSDLPSNQIRAF